VAEPVSSRSALLSSTFALIGVPSSAGAHHAGVEQAPGRLRDAGLIDELVSRGIPVVDRGDLTKRFFAVDHDDPDSRNASEVALVALDVAEAVRDAIADGLIPIVVGGDCTVTLGVIHGLHQGSSDGGLLYFDGDADLATPNTTSTGILDAMVVSHLLGEADSRLARTLGQLAMLRDDQLAMLGYDASDQNSFDRALLERHPALFHRGGIELAQDPRTGATAARRHVERPERPIAVHFDVDTIDSGDLRSRTSPITALAFGLTRRPRCSVSSCGRRYSRPSHSLRSTRRTTPPGISSVATSHPLEQPSRRLSVSRRDTTTPSWVEPGSCSRVHGGGTE